MSSRIFLILLLVALGFSAVGGAFTLTVFSQGRLFQIVWYALVSAVACGLLLPPIYLIDRPRLRLAAFLATAVVLIAWLCGMAAIYFADTRPLYAQDWRQALTTAFILNLVIGIPAIGVSLLRSFRWARFAVPTFLAAAGIGWLLALGTAILQIQVPVFYVYGFYVNWEDIGGGSVFVVYGLGSCVAALLVNLRYGDRRHFRLVGLVAAALAFVFLLIYVWSPRGGYSWFQWSPGVPRIALLALVIAIVLGHLNLVLMVPLRNSQKRFRHLTVAFTILAGLAAATIFTLDFQDTLFAHFLLRFVILFAIAATAGSLALIMLSMLNRKPAAALAPGALTATDITLVCPRCQSRQTLPFGDSTCKNCELLISVKVVEPRCPACGYLLYQLTSPKCPECGAQIRESSTPPPATIPVEA
jgi:hypothetical protein